MTIIDWLERVSEIAAAHPDIPDTQYGPASPLTHRKSVLLEIKLLKISARNLRPLDYADYYRRRSSWREVVKYGKQYGLFKEFEGKPEFDELRIQLKDLLSLKPV